jgi:hypothetical protein
MGGTVGSGLSVGGAGGPMKRPSKETVRSKPKDGLGGPKSGPRGCFDPSPDPDPTNQDLGSLLKLIMIWVFLPSGLCL